MVRLHPQARLGPQFGELCRDRGWLDGEHGGRSLRLFRPRREHRRPPDDHRLRERDRGPQAPPGRVPQGPERRSAGARQKPRRLCRGERGERPELHERLARVHAEWQAVLAEAFAPVRGRLGIDVPLEALVTLVYTFNEGIMLERLSGIEDGHRELLGWIEGWLREREEAAR